MHVAAIDRVGVDREGRYLVTGSYDKTVRVWSIGDGSLIRVLRPPIGVGTEGQINAVAISPDSSVVACGGWTGFAWDRAACIYLFDRESGVLVGRIAGLPNVIKDLSFSQDGRYLAVGLVRGGLRVFTAGDRKLVMADKEYGDCCFGTDWDKKGRLVTSCLDGFLRLYSAAPLLRIAFKVKAPGGTPPFGIRFSPDGSRIAVGYTGAPALSVVSGSLEPLYSPNVTGVATDTNFSKVCWSLDGRTLYAAGMTLNDAGQVFIRSWSEEGRGAFRDIPVTRNTITDMRNLPYDGAPEGALVYASGDPSWGILDAHGTKTNRGKLPSIADYRSTRSSLQLGEDGSSVGFNYVEDGKVIGRLSPPDRTLSLLDPMSLADSSTVQPGLAAPILKAAGLDVADWDRTYRPLLNGVPLTLEKNEWSLSLAIAPGRQKFLLGTDYYLRCFGADGAEKWKVLTNESAWAVNVARNGSLAVAAFGDGTIRWYRMSDGGELLDFFPDADQKRWVLWTPEGYYDASPGGEDLIGWHLNRGTDQAADFYPASRFRALYYRPDVVQLVLTTLDRDEALRMANQASGHVQIAGVAGPTAVPATIATILPPLVTIVSPGDLALASGDTVTVRFSVRAPADAPVTAIRALVDGRSASGARGLDFSAAKETTATAPDGSAVRELAVRIPAHDCEIAILAENKNAVSSPAMVRIKWQRPELPDAPALKPKLYVLAIGVGKYTLPSIDLAFPAKDARDFAAAIKTQGGGLYREVESKLLADNEATKENVLDGLEWIQRQTTTRDVAMVFLSGHGDNDPDGNYYFLTHEFDGEHWKRTAVSYRDIQSTLKDIKGKALFFIDTCHSGGVDGRRTRSKGGQADINGLINDLASAENGVVVFTACTGKQSALEDNAWGNGAFTLALLEAVTGKDRGSVPPTRDARAVMTLIHQSGKATVASLDAYLAERVKQLTGGKQTPTTTKPDTVPDFPIAAVR